LQAADAIFGSASSEEKSAWFERWKTALRDAPDGVAGVIHLLIYYRNRAGLGGKAWKELDAQLNCFRSHADKMQYADYVAAGLLCSLEKESLATGAARSAAITLRQSHSVA
jgi:hypothetical protein